ncbi:hypothetical protein L1049_018279 [Liquidambar formosana]|uniref:Bifunctional inhibitor/plant lipid transfer protein/seed storage helical domain-containing protein n=1 Tax=Liquidambar formosana TaxID=63359 RepID=A0AAP0R9U4_LIQFO
MKVAVIPMLGVLAMIQFMAKPGQATNITCGQVDSCLAPCIPYLTGGGEPVPACCDGVKNLKAMTPTTEDRRAACTCVKEAADRYQNIKG